MTPIVIIILFILASAVGATIIVSQGDIFKPFRNWVRDKAHINQRWVHDIAIRKTDIISKIKYNGNETPIFDLSPEALGDMNSIIKHIQNLTGDNFIKVESDIVGKDIRFFINLKTKSTLSFRLNSEAADRTAGVYETFETVEWIQFIYDMLTCPQCCGFWVGMVWYIISSLCGFIHFHFFLMICFGTVISLLSYLYFKFYTFLEDNSK